MNPGGANPDAVLDIISDNVELVPARDDRRQVARDVVNALEIGGYRIVRAGMVPRLDELQHVYDVMRAASEVLNRGTVDYGAENAAKSIGFLREVAAVVLGLDLDDVDDPAGTE